ARYDFSQPLAMFALTATVYALLRAVRGGLWPIAVAGAALGYAVLTRYEAIVFAPLAAAWVYGAIADRRLLPGLRRVAVLALPIVAALAINFMIANATTPGDVTGDPAPGGTMLPGAAAPIRTMFPFSPSGILMAVLGLLVSPARGLLLFFPLSW